MIKISVVTLHPVCLVWLCTVDNHQQKIVLKRKLLRAGHWCIPETGEVQALSLAELWMWQCSARDDVFPSRTTCWFLSVWKLWIQDRFLSDAIVMALDCKALVGNLIKSLAEVQQNCINLLLSVQSNCEVMYSGDELSLTRSPFPELSKERNWSCASCSWFYTLEPVCPCFLAIYIHVIISWDSNRKVCNFW